MKMSIGADLHKTQFTTLALSEDRKVENEGFYHTNEKGYDSFLNELNEYVKDGYDVSVAVESTGNTRFFKNKLLLAGISVKVVNTLKFKVINESVKKTDKHDAKTLAEFLEKDMLPESILCSQESEDIRRVLKTRSILVRSLVSIKNQVHALLLSYGIESHRGQLQSKIERQRILNGLKDHDFFRNAAATVEPLLKTINNLYQEVKDLEKVLAQMVQDDDDVRLLQTIPGVGLITASTIRAYTDDINRFDSSKHYAAYAGLVPWVQSSNMTIHYGHITKRGPTELRTALVQTVLGMVRSRKQTMGFRIMSKYEDMKKEKGSGKTIIATARKMSTIIYTILKNKEQFDPSKMVHNVKYREMQATAFKVVKFG